MWPMRMLEYLQEVEEHKMKLLEDIACRLSTRKMNFGVLNEVIFLHFSLKAFCNKNVRNSSHGI